MLAFFTFAPVVLFAQDGKKIKSSLKTIVIDPGHGGNDIGARGSQSHEADIALEVGTKLAEMMRDQLPDVKVVMTRTTDVFDNPVEKANKANDAKGDLFISLHCNSTAPVYHREQVGTHTETYYVKKGKKKVKKTRKVPTYRSWTTPSTAKGTETYIYGVGKTASKEKAVMENQSLFMDSSISKVIGDYDPDSPEQIIYLKNKTKRFFTRSFELSQNIEDEFVKVGRESRGGRQRQVGIWVLQAVAMPAVLVEMGFISNPEEEEYMMSKDGQKEIAQVIVNAVKKYKNSLENHQIPANDTTGLSKND